MRMWRTLIVVLSLAMTAPANGQAELEEGLSGALRGCETWVLEPETWADGLGQFTAKLGLGNKAGWVPSVDQAALPPEQLRLANRYFRINSTATAGFILVVSDRVPFCHVTGGGGTDLQPIVEAVLSSSDFKKNWQKIEDRSRADVLSTTFRSRKDPKLQITISRAKKPGERLDRVQVVASGIYDLGE